MAKRDKKRKQGWEPAAKRGNGPPTTSSSSSSKRTQHPDSERTKHKPTTKQQQHQQAPHKQKQHQDPTIPFDVHDRILLVGEGDLSFARSVVEHHGCADVLATTLDPVAELLEKYPQAAAHIQYLEDEGQGVMHEVDATKLAQKELRKGQLWDRVVFNFPHVGGRSKDVNRQVRYNQEMLVKFFKAAKGLLASDGTIVVTLFEGEPYTLWNIRDLGRHCDLELQRSFKFQAGAYPGYSHARTLGNIEGGGGWKGEDRLSRSYIFQARGPLPAQPHKARDRKRKRDDDDSSGDED